MNKACSIVTSGRKQPLNQTEFSVGTAASVGTLVLVLKESAAAEGGCRLLRSQDLQEGFTWNGVTVTNPFAPKKNDLLIALLADGAQS